jgi:threonine dehydratase
MIGLKDIEAAAKRMGPSLYESPLVYSETLSGMTGCTLYLKLENLQMTGSFKERGSLNRLLTMTDEERARGVITASAGNHAQGVAYHATRLGVRSEIWMPKTTPLIKLAATRGYGGEVVLHGANYDEALEGALARAKETGATFVHAFNDNDVIAGQGTLGLEMLRQNPELEAVVVPVGGGGLIGGVACAVKCLRPDIEVVGVQTARLPSMQAALDRGEPVSLPAAVTLADGIGVRRAGSLSLPLVQKYVDRMVSVDEEEIAAAILILLEREKTLAEGAGAVGMAALLHGKTELQGRKVGVVISGGNLDVTLLSRIIERGLMRDGRRLRLRILLPDFPGGHPEQRTWWRSTGPTTGRSLREHQSRSRKYGHCRKQYAMRKLHVHFSHRPKYQRTHR